MYMRSTSVDNSGYFCKRWLLFVYFGLQISRSSAFVRNPTTQTSNTFCRPYFSLSKEKSRSLSKLFQPIKQGTTTPHRRYALPTPSLPLISPSDTWGNLATLTASMTSAQIIGTKTRIGRLLGPPVTAMALTFGLASIGVLPPGGSPAAKSMQWWSLHLATPLVLLGADLEDCGRRCGPLLGSFVAASVGTLLACIVGWQCVGTKWLVPALGNDAIKIAAALLAKNIGGGLNYIAVASSLQTSPDAIAAGLVVDNIFALVYFPLSSALSSNRPDIKEMKNGNDGVEDNFDTPIVQAYANEAQSPTVLSLSSLLMLSTSLLWMGQMIGGSSGALPCCTFLTLLVGFFAQKSRWIQSLQSQAEILGTLCLYLFFATAGAPGIALSQSVRTSVIPLGGFLLCLYGIHFGVLALIRILFPSLQATVPQRLLVASSAAIGGPATAVALCQANKWKSLVVPSLLVGNLGYAIATFIGLLFARIFG